MYRVAIASAVLALVVGCGKSNSSHSAAPKIVEHGVRLQFASPCPVRVPRGREGMNRWVVACERAIAANVSQSEPPVLVPSPPEPSAWPANPFADPDPAR